MSAAKAAKALLAPLLFKEQANDEEVDALFLSLGEAVIATDGEGRINRANKVALDILGYSWPELQSRWYPDAIIAEDRDGNVIPNLERPITQAFLNGQAVSAQVYYRKKDGSRVPVSLNVAPIMMQDRPIGAIEVFRDITEELSLEQAKDDFISIASHQLRTPATGVKQYIGMVLEGYAEKLEPTQRRLLERAYQSNERQLQIIEDLLKVARLDAGNITLNIQKVDLIKLLSDVIREQALKLKGRHLSLSFTHPQRTLIAHLDPDRIRMVLENILDNAIKYTPPGRRIDVKAYKLESQILLQIIDQGVGIAPEDTEKLFQKFQRIANPLSVEAGGTGLGLYWSEKIVKLHGGRINLSSKLNRGTCFSIYLPLQRAKKRTGK